ncbi:Chaperone protein DnaJ [Vibrio crassostreae]|nr:conserved hypothetical protein [Vibrio chagasii]CAK1986134.1 Chaperone protein DnaJ [Vibrio crassostreae]CAH7100830.1 conserved hypothetical protein [Vibrio chagasii]CAK2032043.1 Chaperone protein DnaJ [Vibrio crassostreae]CAK2046047.1 Chaperone protein DnaJ [Vibrio crassostreae]
MDKEIEECTACKGTGVGKVNPLTSWIVNKEDYEPLECQRCNGTGDEPA